MSRRSQRAVWGARLKDNACQLNNLQGFSVANVVETPLLDNMATPRNAQCDIYKATLMFYETCGCNSSCATRICWLPRDATIY